MCSLDGAGGPSAVPGDADRGNEPPTKVLTLFGTRPEIIKLAPVIHQLKARSKRFHAVSVASGQHTDLLYPFARFFAVAIDHDLKIMQPDQTVNGICARALAALDPVLAQESPDLVIVQGDTTTALAGALAAFFRRIPVAHVEAGLRTGDPASPFPEEMNRRLITRVATYHFAATARNRDNLLAEGVDPSCVYITGNPVVDSLKMILMRPDSSRALRNVLRATDGLKRVVMTAHRRENFGELMAGNFRALRAFVEEHQDVALVFPVHPNPAVRVPARAILDGHDRIHLLNALDYVDFIGLLQSAWLIVSDSGGVQEEAPTLGKPLLVLRESTERPEAIEAGVAQLAGTSPVRLRELLESAWRDGTWVEHVRRTKNPFGDGDSGRRIVQALADALTRSGRQRAA